MAGMLHLRTLGIPAFLRPDSSALILQRRPFALLAFVAAAGVRGTSREKALALLWPDTDEERARHSLAQTLYALRRSCGADVIAGSGTLRLDPALVTTDLADLDRALAVGDPERISALYAGAFLDGFHLPNAAQFERWMENERTRLARSVARAYERCAARAAERGDSRTVVACWQRAAALDPLDARVALALVQSLADTGETAAALRQAQLHQTLRRTELDLPPDPALTALAQRLRATPAPAPQNAALGAVTDRMSDDRGEPVAATAESRAVMAEPPAATRDAPVSAPVTGAVAREVVDRPRRRTLRTWRTLRWGAGVLALPLVTAVAFYLRPQRTLDERRVVVAVFENQTGDSALAPLGDMTADWVATELARTGLVDVVDSRAVIGSAPGPGDAESSTGRLGRIGDMRALARTVGAGIVVWGSYYRRADSLEFHAQVTDVRDGALLREVTPIIASAHDPMTGVQRLGSRIMGALATVEDPRLAEWATHGGTPPSYEAYREFVDGLEAQVRMDPATALTHYQRAESLDTTFLQPLLFGADAERELGRPALAESTLVRVAAERDRLIPADQSLLDFQLAELHGQPERAYEAARDMARSSPTSESFVIAGQAAVHIGRLHEALRWFERVDPEKGWVRGWAEYWHESTLVAHLVGDDHESLRLARAARRAFPDELVSYACTLPALASMGDTAAMTAELDSASMAPGSTWWSFDEVLWVAASELAAHGRPRAARRTWQRAANWYAARPLGAAWPPEMRDREARVLLRLGRTADAERVAGDLARTNPGVPKYLATLGVAQAAAGDSADARRAAARLDSLATATDPSDATVRGLVARARARLATALGDRAGAIPLLREALRDDALWSYDLHAAPGLQPLWGYPPFQQIAVVRG